MYTGTWSLVSAGPIPPEQIALARKLVSQMLTTGVPQAFRQLDDGSTIRVLIVNGIPKVTFTQPPPPKERPRLDTTDLWVPRGLVVYPAYANAPFGVGLPIVQNAVFGPYDPENLAPGLNTNRWTVGGPCGEVLLSPDKDAGYPQNARDVVVPLLYQPKGGPEFEWTGQGSYDARPPDGNWSAYRMELSAPVANYPDESTEQVEALFEAINDYRDAQGVTVLNLLPRGYYRPAKVMASIMLTAGSAAETSASYPTTYRTSFDRLTKDGYSAEIAQTSSTSWARGDNPTAWELRASGGTPSGVLAAWTADGPSNDVLTADVGKAAFGDVGYRGGYWCADVISRTRWIEAGNCSWQSADAELPPLSWHGFASVNMAWETYPAVYDAANASTEPLIPIREFTTATGDCWLVYPRATAPTLADAEPAMGRHIYMRGRSIALAPRGGLVWGACLQAFGTVDRLIALVHHPEDQAADYTHEGWTRYLRVWWCDIPRREHLRADPQQVICGEDAGDAWGWKGGELIDVGHIPDGTVAAGVVNSLKMASQWRFARDGSKAVCLRDYGPKSYYGQWAFNLAGSYTAGVMPTATELLFSLTDDAVAVTPVFHPYTASVGKGRRATDVIPVIGAPRGHAYDYACNPIAVDYTPAGELVYLFGGLFGDYKISNNGTINEYQFVGIGAADTVYTGDLAKLTLIGGAFAGPGVDFKPVGPMVADVNTVSVVEEGFRPRWMEDGSANPAGGACIPFNAAEVFGVRMWRNGERVADDWYPMPDGVAASVDPLASGAIYTDLTLCASRNVQVSYAERFGGYVFSAQASPVPMALRVLDSAPSGPNGCHMTLDQFLNGSHWMTYAELNPRGGRAIANVPLPQHDWLIYAKVV